MIRDHFVDGLYDVVLRRFLRNQIKEKPAVTLLDLRATAITWSQDKPAETAPTPTVTAVTAQPDLVDQVVGRMDSMMAKYAANIDTKQEKIMSRVAT